LHDHVHRPDPADTLLVVRCQLGEREAFDALVRRWSTPLHRYAMQLAQDSELARDLVQDVWLRVLRGIGGLREPTHVRAWMFGIAHRTFADRLRARYAMPIDHAVQPETLVADDGDVEDQALMRMLADGVDALPLIEREVVVLFHFEELSLSDIAGVLAIPVGTVKSRLFRARALLRQRLTRGDCA